MIKKENCAVILPRSWNDLVSRLVLLPLLGCRPFKLLPRDLASSVFCRVPSILVRISNIFCNHGAQISAFCIEMATYLPSENIVSDSLRPVNIDFSLWYTSLKTTLSGCITFIAFLLTKLHLIMTQDIS